jgi:RNA-directed DNA polymerase
MRQRGLDRPRAYGAAYNGQGPWRNAGASHMNHAFRKSFFDNCGLLSILELHRRLNYAA